MALQRLEQAVGLRWLACSPLFAADTERLVQLRHLIFDPMHTVLSGGVAATQLSGLLEACKSLGVPAERLDAYATCWRAPSFLAAVGGAVLPRQVGGQGGEPGPQPPADCIWTE